MKTTRTVLGFSGFLALLAVGCNVDLGHVFCGETCSGESGGSGGGGSGGGPTGSGSAGSTQATTAPSTSTSTSVGGTAGGGSGGWSGGAAGSGSGSGGTTCTPKKCQPGSCGVQDDGCGAPLNCTCDPGMECGADHVCQACVPLLSEDQVCAGGKCGPYLDECGNQHVCDGYLPQGHCGQYQVCPSALDPANPPDWNDVPTCFGCGRVAIQDPNCGASPTPYAWQCPPAYHNGTQDAGETDVDCGGPNPVACKVGQSCKISSDCKDLKCTVLPGQTTGVCENTNLTGNDCIFLGNLSIHCCPSSG